MTFDPNSVEITCVTLPKDHCVQVPWKYIKVCGYSDLFSKTWTKITTYYIPHTTYIHNTHWMSDHIVSFWTKFRRDKKEVNTLITRYCSCSCFVLCCVVCKQAELVNHKYHRYPFHTRNSLWSYELWEEVMTVGLFVCLFFFVCCFVPVFCFLFVLFCFYTVVLKSFKLKNSAVWLLCFSFR